MRASRVVDSLAYYYLGKSLRGLHLLEERANFERERTLLYQCSRASFSNVDNDGRLRQRFGLKGKNVSVKICLRRAVATQSIQFFTPNNRVSPAVCPKCRVPVLREVFRGLSSAEFSPRKVFATAKKLRPTTRVQTAVVRRSPEAGQTLPLRTELGKKG